MKYFDLKNFEAANKFGMKHFNESESGYIKGVSFIEPLITDEASPVIVENVTFEPGSYTNWHVHISDKGGGQFLICTAGEGWYREEGKKIKALSEGSFVYVASGIKHWHGAKKDSWFSHIVVSLKSNVYKTTWFDQVNAFDYETLHEMRSKKVKSYFPIGNRNKIKSKTEFTEANMFGVGMYNFMLSKYFVGKSYLKMLTVPGRTPLFFANVNFEPGCRNHWHIHHATRAGGQVLICTTGTGWYQEEGKPAIILNPGTVIYIPAEVKHWHGATSDSWFSHIAIEIPGDNGKLEWCEAVSDDAYKLLR